MISPVETHPRSAVDIHALHSEFLTLLPRIETHARIRFRHYRCPGRRDDAVAEVIAVSWRWFLRLTEKGKDVNSFVMVLADFAARHIRSDRRLCGQERARDVFSSRAQRTKGFRVESLPATTRRSHDTLYGDPHGQGWVNCMEERLRDNMQSPVPDQAAFRVDFPQWLARLGDRKRQIAVDLALEGTVQELAAKYQLSPGRISQMRREFHADWAASAVRNAAVGAASIRAGSSPTMSCYATEKRGCSLCADNSPTLPARPRLQDVILRFS